MTNTVVMWLLFAIGAITGLLIGWLEWGVKLRQAERIDLPELYRWRRAWESHYGSLEHCAQARLVLLNLKAHADNSELSISWSPGSKGPWGTMGLRETLRQGEGVTWADLEPLVERQPLLVKAPDALQRYIKERGAISLANLLRWQAARP